MTRARTPAEVSAGHRHTASVCRSEAIARRDRQPDFAATLDRWADHQDRLSVQQPDQRDLFQEHHNVVR